MLAHGDPALGEVLGVLDATVLRIAHAHDLEATVSEVAILDRTDPGTVHAGAVVLAVGVDPEEGEAVALVDRAARTGASAVVFRCAGVLPDRLCSARVTLCTVPPEMAWGQLYALVRTAMSGGRASHAQAAGVPVGDLFALADAVAAAVGAPVTIEDPQWRVLAYSNLDDQPIDEPRRQTILGRTPPEVWQQRLDDADVRRRLRAGEGVVRFEHEDLAPRFVAPVRAGGELVGALWAAQGAEPVDTDALLRYADLAAIHLIAHRAADDLTRRARGAVVRELLEGVAAPPAAWPGRVSAVVFAVDEEWSGDPDRVLSIVQLYATALHRGALCAAVEDRIWAIVPMQDAEKVVAMARNVIERVAAVLHAGVRAAVGEGAEVTLARRSAETALAVPRAEAVVHVDDVRSHAALLEVLDRAAGVGGVRDGRAAALPDQLAQTLRAWLDAHGDVAAAAAQLSIHPNTLRYRLRRVEQVGGIDLADPDERLIAALALRLADRTNSEA